MFSLDRESDTICAQSTAPGVGALAVIRLSGDQSLRILKILIPNLSNLEIETHRAYYGFLKDADGALIDEVVATFFKAGRSFTGEDSVEISCHGSAVLINEIMRAMILSGARAAEPGEFTYRAFINGRIDLVQAESVLQLIESRSKSAAQLALRQLRGELSKSLAEICDDLTWGLSRLEANIDFSAEDIEFASEDVIYQRLERAKIHIDGAIDSYRSGRIILDGLRVAIVGEPNVGKSSLLNRLLSEDRAIVSPHAGTTRDTVEGEALIGGYRFVFIDTAGLREAADEIEALGIARSCSEIEKSDLVMFVSDVLSGEPDNLVTAQLNGKAVLRVINKIDIADSLQSEISSDSVWVSAKSGAGFERLVAELGKFAKAQTVEESSAVVSLRQFEMLMKARDFLNRGLDLIRDRVSYEFVIAELQASLRVCMQITGQVFDDDVIDRVFRDFCLGK